jgi:hypothetical protein
MNRRLINGKHRVDPDEAMVLTQEVLYHGTSTARLKHILNDGRLRKVAVIEQDKVSLTNVTLRSTGRAYRYSAITSPAISAYSKRYSSRTLTRSASSQTPTSLRTAE